MSKYTELPIGAKFGMLTVLERAPDRIAKSGRHKGAYRCICDCGNETIVDTYSLKSGTTKSCGCLKKTGNKPTRSLVGQIFGKLTVLERAEDYISQKGTHRHQWKCLCRCGRETIVADKNLTSGNTKSCGHCRFDDEEKWRKGYSANFIDLTGMKFGLLEVVSRAPDRVDSKGRKHTAWWTKCSCGNPELYYADAERLRIGHVKSCGCLRHEGNPKDYTGKIINGYEVLGLKEIKDTPSGKKIKWWRCRDAEGKVLTLPAYILSVGTGKPAPCRRKQNRYEFFGDHVIGYTEDGKTFIIDVEDYDKIKDFYWFIDKHNGYVETRIERKRLSLHRFIMNAGNGDIIDHKSHNTADNRKVNLRVVTPMQNCINRKLRANNTSGCTGVYFHKGCYVSPWRASITVNKKMINLGSYEHFEDAVAARKAAEEKYFGAYSYDNSVSSVTAVEGISLDGGKHKGDSKHNGDGVAFCDGTETDTLLDVTVAIDTIDPVSEFDVLTADAVPVP